LIDGQGVTKYRATVGQKHISRGSLATYLLLRLTMTEYWKLVGIWQNYRQDYSTSFTHK